MADLLYRTWHWASHGQASEMTPDLADLQAFLTRLFAGSTAILAFGIVLVLGTVVGRAHGPILAIAAALGATAAVSALVPSRYVALAAEALIVGLLATEALAPYLFPDSLVACTTPLIVLVAVDLLGGRGGLATTIAATVITSRLVSAPPIAWTASMLAWATLCLCWLGTRPFVTAIAWVTLSSAQAHAATEEARAHQAELARMSRNLRLALEQLTLANQDLERARAAANAERQRKVEFATTVSHELRTPLNLIIGFSEMMVLHPQTYADETLPDAYRGDVAAIYRNACHLSNLIDDVLDLSQIDVRRMALQIERCDLPAIVDQAIAAVIALFHDKGVRLVVEHTPCLPPLLADPTRLRQIMINLLANAARFTDRGQVMVSTRLVDSAVEVSVIDTGPGIPVEELRQIFTDFHRAGTRRQVHTSGLGLAICKRLVELHGGRIWVESHPGAGATFTFRLPLSPMVPTDGASWQTWVKVDRNRVRPILAAVTDDQDVLRLLRRYLDHYDVHAVGTVGEVVTLARSHRAQAVLVASPLSADVETAFTSDLPSGMPVIECSFTTNQTAGQSLGAAAYLTKPVTRAQLRAALPGLGETIRSLLVVDDDVEMVRLLARMLQAEAPPCEVWRADGGQAALSLLETRRPDAIVLDLLMPEVDGYAVLERVRTDPNLCAIPVIIVSAKGNVDERVTADHLLITRQGGLPIADIMGCLHASLDLLLGAAPSGSVPAPRGAMAD